MRIVFFINKSNGFPAGMISYMEEHFPDQEMEFYTVDRRCEESLPDLPNVHRIHSYRQFLFDSDLIRQVRQADKIIVSGVFTLQYVLPIYGSSVLRKTWWQFWGGDYEDLQRDGREISRRNRINEKVLAHNLKLAGGIILLTRPERSIFLKIFPFAEQKPMYYVPVPDSKEKDELVQEIMVESNVVRREGGAPNQEGDATKTRVVLGNSATDSNRHLAVFDMLKHLKSEGVELCCPLSYGNAEYRQKVIERGTELFGESFHPITEYMSFEEYIRFLCSCSVGIYYNNRQQALGNINRILGMGKKVFLPEILRAYYEEYGFITFRSEDLAGYSTEDLLHFSEQDRQHNLECVIRQKEAMERTWAEIIEGVIVGPWFHHRCFPQKNVEEQMRIAIINVTAMSGSTGKIAYGMYRSLKADGREVRLYYGRNDDVTENDEICRFTSKASVYMHALLTRLTGLQGCYSSLATRRLIRDLEQNPPDLVQLYNLHGYYINVGMLLRYLKDRKIPTVYSMLDEYPYLGRCCYSFDCDQFQTGCLHCRQDRKEYPATILFRRGRKALLDKQKAYDGFERLCFTAPQWVLDRAESSYLLKGKRMYCVDEYVDTDTTFYPRSLKRGEYHKLPEKLIQWRREGKKLVLTVAPYTYTRKGGHYFLEMAERFRKAGTVQGEYQDNAGLGLLRDGSDGLPGESQQAPCIKPCEGSIPSEGPIDGSGDQNIRFIYVGMNDQTVEIPGNCYAVGFVKDQDLLAEYYSIADVFVCTSLADTMPNVILDALACGTPVIGFDNTGIPYTAEEPLGTFVPTGDVNALCKAVSEAPRKTNALSDECRSYALQRYSPEVYYRRMQDVYRELLHG